MAKRVWTERMLRCPGCGNEREARSGEIVATCPLCGGSMCEPQDLDDEFEEMFSE